jgi:peptide/nickel transport system ATP-binding protein
MTRTPAAPGHAVTVRGLTIASRAGMLVHGVDLDVPAGAAVGLVGESGSGKSLTLRSVIGLLPRGVEVTGGSIGVTGRLGMVFQDPSGALDPLVTVGSQVVEVCRHVRGMTKTAARRRAVELFEEVGIPDPERRLRSYPHELSGGQRQRVVLAVALAAEPDVLLCVERRGRLVERLRVDRGLTVVFVSHDLAVVSQVCSTVSVMQAGRVVESGTVDRVVGAPQHPYTRTLLDAVLEIPEAGAL